MLLARSGWRSGLLSYNAQDTPQHRRADPKLQYANVEKPGSRGDLLSPRSVILGHKGRETHFILPSLRKTSPSVPGSMTLARVREGS